MHAIEIVISVMTGLGVISGLAFGGLASPVAIRTCRYVVTGAVVLFTATVVTGARVARFGAIDELEATMLAIFWVFVATALVCIFGFFAGVSACCRRTQRRTGALLVGLSLLIVPIFGLVGLVVRLLR